VLGGAAQRFQQLLLPPPPAHGGGRAAPRRCPGNAGGQRHNKGNVCHTLTTSSCGKENDSMSGF